jgi:hypothetical protein
MSAAATRGRVLLSALLAFSSCACSSRPVAHAPDPARVAPPADPLLAEPFDVSRIVAQVSAHRGLAARAPVTLEENAALPSHYASSKTDWDRLEQVWRALGLIAKGESPGAKLPAVFDTGMAGLYDGRARLIWVRKDQNHAERTRAWTLLHEVEHSLQDPAFLERGKRLEGDEALAARALREGDADVTAAAFVHSRMPSMDHWMAEFLGRLGDDTRNPKVLEGAPAWLRRQWLFPYVEGTQFVGAMYRAGGYALVDRLFEHPPASTEQVLHPEKYVAGELPVPVAIPPVPDGYVGVAGGTMGELRTAALLQQCAASARDLAADLGWGGDAFVIFADPAGNSGVLWSTVWDDEAAAVRFEHMMLARETCLGPAGAEADVRGAATIVRDGTKVAYARGLPAELRATMAPVLLALPGPRPAPAPPVGPVRLRPLPDPRSFLAKGRLIENEYVSQPLGLRISMQGFEAVATSEWSEVTAEAYSGISRVDLRLLALPTSPAP